jgi:hypothetical protein
MATNQNYTLSATDMAVWPAIINMQNILGAGRPAIDDTGSNAFIWWIHVMTLDLLRTSNGAGGWNLASNTPHYQLIGNPQLKSWMDDFFGKLTSFQTNYGSRNLPEVYVGYMYHLFVATSECPDCFNSAASYYPAFASGAASDPDLMWDDCKSNTVGPWARPGKPDSWSAAINNTFAAWGTGGVPGVLGPGLNLFKTANWTNVQDLKPATASLWVNQAAALADLQSQPALDDDGCLFLLYLLCSLGTGDAAGQKQAQTITSFPTNSLELPNDSFIDTLIYYIMMIWVDPLGSFGFNGDGIRGTLNTINGLLVNTDPGTQAIKTCIGKNLKILNAAPTYPMTDPYNPNIAFNTRKSDLLEAINSVWPCR